MHKELGCASLTWCTTAKKEHSAATRNKLNNRTELNVSEWFGVELSSAGRRVVHVVPDSDWVPPRSTPFPWPFQGFYINRFYRNDFLKLRSS